MARKKGQKSPRNVCIGLRAKAWWVIRKHKVVTLQDLLMTVANGTEKAAYNNLRNYMRALGSAGILKVEEVRMPDGKLTSNGLIRYRLEKDIGPKAPVVRRHPAGVYDPNADQEITKECTPVQAGTISQERTSGGIHEHP